MKRLVLYGVLFLFAIWMIIPFLWTLSTSFSSETNVISSRIIPQKLTAKNYKESWYYPSQIEPGITMGNFFLNSLVVSFFITVLSVFTDSMAGYVLSRKKFKGREFLFFLSISTMMIPFYVTSIPMFLIVRKFGWINSYFGLIVPFIGSGFGVYMFRQAFLTIPKEIEEAGRLDGLSETGIYLRIMLPLVKPTFATMIIFKAMWSWNIFYWPLLIISKMKMYTLPLGLTLFKGLNVTKWGLLTAGLVIAMTPVIIIFLLMQRHFIRGLTKGAVKG